MCLKCGELLVQWFCNQAENIGVMIHLISLCVYLRMCVPACVYLCLRVCVCVCVCASACVLPQALEKAKEAGRKERALVRQREQSGNADHINADLTFSVSMSAVGRGSTC